MLMRSCAHCDASIEHLHAASRYCAKRCKDAANYAKHATARRAQQAEYRAANKARRAAYDAARSSRAAEHAARYRANPDEYKRARDARRGHPALPYTARDWRRILHHYRHACAYCGSRDRIEKEHVIPLSRGGIDSIGNVVPACFSCNRSKHAKLLIEWRALKGLM